MFSNVPQFIHTEDKIVGPLTAKQLGWLAAGGFVLLIAWNALDSSAFIISAIIVVIIFGGFAFYRPFNQSLATFILSSINFTFRPKVYIWERNYGNMKTIRVSKTKNKKEESHAQKTIDEEKISSLSEILDQSGKNLK